MLALAMRRASPRSSRRRATPSRWRWPTPTGYANRDDLTRETLRDWINARVAARYQRVDRVVIMPDFPRNAAGKTLKREMRLVCWEGREKVI